MSAESSSRSRPPTAAASTAAMFPDAAGRSLAQSNSAPAPATPIPYPNAGSGAGPMATGWETTNAVNRVKLQTKKGVSAAKASAYTSTRGDEAGSLKGIVSHQQPGKASMLPAARAVKVEGKTAVRHLDPLMNRF